MNAKMLEKAKPILMSTPMVQASMRDINPKTQTRRVVNIPNWTTDSYDELFIDVHGNLCATCDDTGCDAVIKPRYQPGDILWVRETWVKWENGLYYYKADPTPEDKRIRDCVKWKPSIHMPREAARLFLRVTGVRAERLQDISVADAKDEGIRVHAHGCIDGLAFGCYNGDDCINNVCNRPIELYQELWDRLNAKRNDGIYAWNKNPWVWVYTFERIAGQ